MAADLVAHTVARLHARISIGDTLVLTLAGIAEPIATNLASTLATNAGDQALAGHALIRTASEVTGFARTMRIPVTDDPDVLNLLVALVGMYLIDAAQAADDQALG